jgi:hypothetical protein
MSTHIPRIDPIAYAWKALHPLAPLPRVLHR